MLISKGFSVQAVKLSTAVIFLLRPIGQAVYVHTHYNIDKKILFDGEPIKQKWNGFAQHVAGVVLVNNRRYSSDAAGQLEKCLCIFGIL